MRNFLRRIHYWFRTNTEQAQLDEEMRLHIALRAGGMSPEEASQAAPRIRVDCAIQPAES